MSLGTVSSMTSATYMRAWKKIYLGAFDTLLDLFERTPIEGATFFSLRLFPNGTWPTLDLVLLEDNKPRSFEITLHQDFQWNLYPCPPKGVYDCLHRWKETIQYRDNESIRRKAAHTHLQLFKEELLQHT